MVTRLTVLALMIGTLAGCAMHASQAPVATYGSIELSQGVVKLINEAGSKPIALENDDRIHCVDLDLSADKSPSRFCQTREEFNSNIERRQDLIHSINASPQ
jgi:hypothetical protein